MAAQVQGHRAPITVAQAGADAFGAAVKAAIPIPVVGGLAGWAVAESMKYLLVRIQAARQFRADFTEIAGLMQSPELAMVVKKLDQLTDMPDFEQYRQKFNTMCEVMATVSLLLAQAEVAMEAGKITREWQVVKRSWGAERLAEMKGQLEDLCADEYYFQLHNAAATPVQPASQPAQEIASFLQLSVLPAELEEPSATPTQLDDMIPDLPEQLIQHGIDLVPQVEDMLASARNIGIVGMPGIGKTTVARVVYARVRSLPGRFDHFVWLTVGRQPDTLRLLDSAFEQLFESSDDVPDFDNADPVRGLKNLTAHVCKKRWRVFLVLDDVCLGHPSSRSIVSALNFVTASGQRVDGSRLVVTTSQRSSLSHLHPRSHTHARPLTELAFVEVPTLDPQHAKQLFQHHAFVPGEDSGHPTYWGNARLWAINECGGHPGALEELGCHQRYRKTTKKWGDGLAEMRDRMRTGTDKQTKRCSDCVNDLPHSVRDCFISFAAFRQGAQVPEADLLHLFATHSPLHSAVSVGLAAWKLQVLLLNCLVSVSIKDGRRVYSMHRILHGIASRMASSQKACTRSFHRSTVPKSTPPDVKSVRYLSIHGSVHLTQALQRFDGAKLQACIVDGVCPETLPPPWPPSLRYLNLDGHLTADLKKQPYTAKLLVLCSLRLTGPVASHLPPKSLLPARQLMYLDLSGCDCLEQLPDCLALCTQLMHLDLSRCSKLQALPDKLGACQELLNLNLSGCLSLKLLPHTIGGCSKLTQLNFNCSESPSEWLKTLPDGLNSCAKLVLLDLCGCRGLEALPVESEGLTSLAHLDLSRCASLMQLPQCIGAWTSLTHLNLRGCSRLAELPERITDRVPLMHLKLEGCARLNIFPGTSCGRLTYLDLSKCAALQELPPSLCDCSRLVHLDLSGCSKLQTLPDSVGQCDRLEIVNISMCPSLKFEALPESLSRCGRLRAVSLAQNSGLTSVPQCLIANPSLQCLDLSNCDSLQMLPQLPHSAVAARLTQLNLHGCTCIDLRCFPDSIGGYSQLVHLDASGCQQLSLPSWIHACNLLSHLNLSMRSNPELPQILSGFSQLAHLNLSQCCNMQRLPGGIQACVQLTHLDLSKCTMLQRLPDTIVACHQLAYLDLSECDSLQCIPDEIVGCSRLRTLDLSGCVSLKQLPGSMCHCSQLEYLSIVGCTAVELPDELGLCSKLMHLKLDDANAPTLLEKFMLKPDFWSLHAAEKFLWVRHQQIPPPVNGVREA